METAKNSSDVGKESKTSMYMGVIYCRELRWPIDPMDIMIGTPYIGQSVRPLANHPTAQHLAKTRWTEEDQDSKRGTGCDACFLEALRIFGVGAFWNHIIAWKQGTHLEVQEWADQLETLKIKECGGTLRDMNPLQPLHQCWNLTAGGKGCNWRACLEITFVKVWKRFQSEMQAYVLEFKTSVVLRSYVNKTNQYKLGEQVRAVRKGRMVTGKSDEDERRAWCAALPEWVWNLSDLPKDATGRKFRSLAGQETYASRSQESKRVAEEKRQLTITNWSDAQRMKNSKSIREGMASMSDAAKEKRSVAISVAVANVDKERAQIKRRATITANAELLSNQDRLDLKRKRDVCMVNRSSNQRQKELDHARATGPVPFIESNDERVRMRNASTNVYGHMNVKQLYMLTPDGQNIVRVQKCGKWTRKKSWLGPVAEQVL